MNVKIQILWPTVRPSMMDATCNRWYDAVSGKVPINLTVGVSTEEMAAELKPQLPGASIIVTGTDRPGPVWAVHRLASTVRELNDQDIIIVATDDFDAPWHWDLFLAERMKNFCGALLIKDGVRKPGDRVMAMPIMTYGCFVKLNRIIVHPDYTWHYSDAELYENLSALGMLHPAQGESHPVFQHNHWTIGKRPRDSVDKLARRMHVRDRNTFQRRMKMSVQERLVYKEGARGEKATDVA